MIIKLKLQQVNDSITVLLQEEDLIHIGHVIGDMFRDILRLQINNLQVETITLLVDIPGMAAVHYFLTDWCDGITPDISDTFRYSFSAGFTAIPLLIWPQPINLQCLSILE